MACLLWSRTWPAVIERRSASGVPPRAAAPLHMAGHTPVKQVHQSRFTVDRHETVGAAAADCQLMWCALHNVTTRGVCRLNT